MASKSGFLSIGDVYLGDLPDLHQGCQGPFLFLTGKVRFLSRRCSGKQSHLLLRGESRGFYKLRPDIWNSSGVATGTSGTHSCCLRKVKSPFKLGGASRDSSPVSAGHRASSPVEFGTSGFLFSSDMDLGVPMEFQQGSQASSRVETWNSASLSRCKRSVRLSVVRTQGSGTISLGARAVTPPLVFWVDPRVPVKSMQGNQAYLEWLVKLGFFELRRDSWGCAPV